MPIAPKRARVWQGGGGLRWGVPREPEEAVPALVLSPTLQSSCSVPCSRQVAWGRPAPSGPCWEAVALLRHSWPLPTCHCVILWPGVTPAWPQLTAVHRQGVGPVPLLGPNLRRPWPWGVGTGTRATWSSVCPQGGKICVHPCPFLSLQWKLPCCLACPTTSAGGWGVRQRVLPEEEGGLPQRDTHGPPGVAALCGTGTSGVLRSLSGGGGAAARA